MASPASTSLPSFVPWSDIKGFHYVMRKRSFAIKSPTDGIINDEIQELSVEEEEAFSLSKLQYRSKVKLHGTNGGVNISSQGILAQSRNQFITDTRDGFHKLVQSTHDYWHSLIGHDGHESFVVFGEHCGPKVQKGTALNRLSHDIFAVFGIDLGDDRLIVDPVGIELFLTRNKTIPLPMNGIIHVVPWHEFTISFDFTSRDKCQSSLDEIDAKVNEIDREDPWVKSTFNLVGHGEGLVFYPMLDATITNGFLHKGCFSSLAFKAKGIHHRVVSSYNSASLTPNTANTPEDFAIMVCPEPRLLQGLNALGGFQSPDCNSKKFSDWVASDVVKECVEEMKASGFKWKDLKEHVRTHAFNWFVREFALSFVDTSHE